MEFKNNKDISILHKMIIQEIISFCKENKIEADEVRLLADNLQVSIEEGRWHPTTDSALQFFNKNELILESL